MNSKSSREKGKRLFFFIGDLYTDAGENIEGGKGRLLLKNEAAAFLQNIHRGVVDADVTGRISDETGVGQLPSDKLPVRTTIVYGARVRGSMRHSKQKK